MKDYRVIAEEEAKLTPGYASGTGRVVTGHRSFKHVNLSHRNLPFTTSTCRQGLRTLPLGPS